ncbi:deoxycytidine triphosphate deaminase [Stenotrophomonas phage C121]|uniref:dCTP deaminase n=1 Tax=Stenotrophomonas phage C121 TaxID=2914029 RepID=UPI0023293F76|nr:dCTP deaminase [Stenotrophomonas phage C121]UKL14778.1 deoxycytidine triphosphate deaminase [Stenotrophomonas phage C121]
MIINGQTLLHMAPIKAMLNHKASNGDTSYGLSEAGYDIRIKQDIRFAYSEYHKAMRVSVGMKDYVSDHFTLASAIEEFQMPGNLVGIVHDKSTWARRGLSVFNTVIEPGWNGFLTLELVYHGQDELIIPAGSGIAQVVFHQTSRPAYYDGKYQNQEDQPVAARKSP